MPGKPVAAPAVRNPHPINAARKAPGSERAGVARNPNAAAETRNVPPHQNAGRPAPPEASTRTETRAHPPAGASRIPPHVIARTPPPPPIVPFDQRRPAMVEHPGRPLEPPQIDDLRAGRPVGPMRDHEFPSHAVPVLREAPRPALPARPRPPHP
jgi:hypothetical protein